MANMSTAHGTLTIKIEDIEELRNILDYFNNQAGCEYNIGLFGLHNKTSREELIKNEYKNGSISLEFFGTGQWAIEVTIKNIIEDMLEKITVTDAEFLFEDLDYEPGCMYFVEESINYIIKNNNYKGERTASPLEINIENIRKLYQHEDIYNFEPMYLKELIEDLCPSDKYDIDKLSNLFKREYVKKHNKQLNEKTIIYSLEDILSILEISIDEFDNLLDLCEIYRKD